MIGSTYLFDKELKKEIKRYTDKLRKRINRIRVLGDKAMQDAVAKFDEYISNRKKITPKTERAELLSYYRQLKYIDSLKSSTVKGALEAGKNASPILKSLKGLSEDKQKKFWEVYNKMVNKAGLFDRFKYEIWKTTLDLMLQGEDTEKIINDMITDYDDLILELGSAADDETIQILYTERLQGLRK